MSKPITEQEKRAHWAIMNERMEEEALYLEYSKIPENFGHYDNNEEPQYYEEYGVWIDSNPTRSYEQEQNWRISILEALTKHEEHDPVFLAGQVAQAIRYETNWDEALHGLHEKAWHKDPETLNIYGMDQTKIDLIYAISNSLQNVRDIDWQEAMRLIEEGGLPAQIALNMSIK